MNVIIVPGRLKPCTGATLDISLPIKCYNDNVQIRRLKKRVFLHSVCLEQVHAKEYRVFNGDGECPVGYTIATYDEAVADQSSARQAFLNLEWGIARLADGGSMEGGGYEFRMRGSDGRKLGHTLCWRPRVEEMEVTAADAAATIVAIAAANEEEKKEETLSSSRPATASGLVKAGEWDSFASSERSSAVPTSAEEEETRRKLLIGQAPSTVPEEDENEVDDGTGSEAGSLNILTFGNSLGAVGVSGDNGSVKGGGSILGINATTPRSRYCLFLTLYLTLVLIVTLKVFIL
jgi:hypothetical protein